MLGVGCVLNRKLNALNVKRKVGSNRKQRKHTSSLEAMEICSRLAS